MSSFHLDPITHFHTITFGRHQLNFLQISYVISFYLISFSDIFLYALDMEWELCEDAIAGSELLSKMFQDYQNPSPSSSSNIEGIEGSFGKNFHFHSSFIQKSSDGILLPTHHRRLLTKLYCKVFIYLISFFVFQLHQRNSILINHP